MKIDIKAFARPWMGPLIALVGLYVVFGVMTDGNFLRGVTQVTIARQTVVVALGAIGMTLVIVSGGIDLSIGSVVALAAVVVAKALDAGYGPLTAAAHLGSSPRARSPTRGPLAGGASLGHGDARAVAVPRVPRRASIRRSRGSDASPGARSGG